MPTAVTYNRRAFNIFKTEAILNADEELNT
jgi:hypothetical protein